MSSSVAEPPPTANDGREGPPQIPPPDGRPRNRKEKAATGASAAGIRAVSAQLLAFYFRAPIKAFFRTRVDYMAYARAINPRIKANAGWSWKTTTPGLLAHAIKTYGWGFIPNQVLPPMIANVSVGAILYTSYLQTLGFLHEPSSHSTKRVYPPAPISDTFAAGFIAGSIQSLVAAPLDALTVRFETNEMLEGQYKSMWEYARVKLKTIGLRGVFAGYSLSFLKDSAGYGVFFSVFEYTKSQVYHSFLRHHYERNYSPYFTSPAAALTDPAGNPLPMAEPPTVKPHYMVEPTFIALAGLSASIAQQTLQHPISRIQDLHYSRLESLDHTLKYAPSGQTTWRIYYNAYMDTFQQAKMQATRVGGWRKWIYNGFVRSLVRNVPSSAAGLVVFEIVRRRYGGFGDEDEEKAPSVVEGDGVRILLN